MQARFLKKVVDKYHASKVPSVPQPGEVTSATQPPQTQGDRPPPYLSNAADLQTQNHWFGPGGSGSGSGTYDAEAYDNKANFETFADKDMWDALFTDTGFWMGESIFSSDMNLI